MKCRGFALATAVLVTLAILSGCTASQKEGTGAPAFKAAMATDTAGPDDDAFNAAAWRGLQKAKGELNAEVQAIRAKRQEEFESNVQFLAEQRVDLIWGIGFVMTDAVDKISKKHPAAKFGLIDGTVGNPNVASVTFKEEEGAFLEGIIAARATRSKKVGFVGGMSVDATHHYEAGFRAGVKAADPKVEVITGYANSFIDPAKGKAVALSLIDKGVDLLFHAAGTSGTGVIEAAREKNKLAIGADTDQKKLAPDHVISSMIKHVDVAVFEVTLLAKSDRFPGGKTTVMGLKENGVGYSDTSAWEKLPAGTRELVDKWSEAVKVGKVAVPNTLEKLSTWEVPKL